jgi:hypothetical protein
MENNLEIISTEPKDVTISSNRKERSVEYYQSESEILQALIDSKALPAWCDTKEKAFVIAQKAKELNIGIMAAFDYLIMVQGKITLNANGINSLIQKAGYEIEMVYDYEPQFDSNGEVIDYITTINLYMPSKLRPGVINKYTDTFRYSDAIRAGITGNPTWQKYPKQMMFARCLTNLCRRFAPNILGGLYTNEEIQSINAEEK